MSYVSGMEFFDEARQAADLFLDDHPYGAADELLPWGEVFRGSYNARAARVEIPTRYGMLLKVHLNPRTREVVGVDYVKRSLWHRIIFPVTPSWVPVLALVVLAMLIVLRFALRA